MERMINPPEHKKMPMLIATVISMVIIFGVLQVLVTRFTEMIYFSIFA